MDIVQKYTIVAFIKSIQNGMEFAETEWPLHVTIAPRFAIHWDDDIDNKIKTLATSQKTLTVAAQNDNYFGPNKNIPVTELAQNAHLNDLHKQLVYLLESYGAVFDEPHYNYQGYKPHITINSPANRVVESDTIVLDHIAVVDMYPHEDIHKRKVIAIHTFTVPQDGVQVAPPRTSPHFSSLPLFSGRLGVGGYWLGQVYIFLLALMLVIAVLGVGNQLYFTNADPMVTLLAFITTTIISVIFIFSLLIFELSLIIRRSHDIATLGNNDPLLFYFFHGPMVLFGKGDIHPNKYGAPIATINPLIILGLKTHPRQ